MVFPGCGTPTPGVLVIMHFTQKGISVTGQQTEVIKEIYRSLVLLGALTMNC